jgi:predicted nucleotidyltransferase
MVSMKKLSTIKKIIGDQKALLRDRYKINRIGVFGSYVRGDTHSGSDVDVIVEFSEPISLIRLVSLENYLSGIVGVKVDVVPKEDIRKELKDTILKEAVYV